MGHEGAGEWVQFKRSLQFSPRLVSERKCMNLSSFGIYPVSSVASVRGWANLDRRLPQSCKSAAVHLYASVQVCDQL